MACKDGQRAVWRVHTAKGVEWMGPAIRRDRLGIGAQPRKVVFLYMLKERIDLSHEGACDAPPGATELLVLLKTVRDRKSTRLNSSHLVISYAVFCLKKKKKK